MALNYNADLYPINEYWCSNGSPIRYIDMKGEHIVYALGCLSSWEDHPRRERLIQEFNSRYGDINVKMRDSIVAGFCEGGTKEWLNKHFGSPDITGLSMKALVPHLGDERVKQVVIYLIRKQGN